LENLTKLRELSLFNNKIIEIKGLESLNQLKKLKIYNNLIPREIIEDLGGLNTDNEVKNIKNFIDFCRKNKKQKEKVLASDQNASFNRKIRLFGMIKAMKEFDILEAIKFLGINEDKIKGLLFDLIGEGKVEGNLNGNKFTIRSSVDDFIEFLDTSFVKWEEDEIKKQQKI
jgi:hypothetical protein